MAGILPPATGADIGAPGDEWEDVYLAGQMIDASANAVSVADITGHIADTDNPHSVTAAQICAEAKFTGLHTPTDFTVAYDEPTRVITVTVGADTDVYIDGVCHTITAGTYAQTAHADTTDDYYCFVNSSGVITTATSFVFGSVALIAYVYYNATTNQGVLFDERHPDTWPADIHSHFHQVDGARLVTGGTVSGYTTGSSTTADMQYDIDSTVFDDESLRETLAALTGADGAYTYWHRSGTDVSGEWSWVTGANLPFPVSGTQAQYNRLTGGSWQLTNVSTANRWMTVWVIGTNAYGGGNHRFINIVGQTLYTSLATAQAASFLTAISWGELPFAEIVPLAKIIIRYTNTAGNDFDFVSVESIRGTKAAITSTVAPTIHNALAGRSDEGAHPATAVAVDASGFDGNLAATDDSVQDIAQKFDDVRLDTILAPTDTTANNVSITAHGLCPKAPNSASQVLLGTGVFGSPPTVRNVTISVPADLSFTGISQTVTAGESVAFGDVLYLKSDGKYYKTDSDAKTTMPASRIATSTASANANVSTIALGILSNSAWAWASGAILYVSGTPGAMTETKPDICQSVGYAISATSIYFSPSAYAETCLSDDDPEPTGTASSGTASLASRADHVHESTGGAFSVWTAVESVTRTDSNTLAKAGLESVLPVGTHVRMYSGSAAPTTLTDWKHGYVIAVGSNAVDICGEEVPTGGASLFVEYSTNISITMDMPTRTLSGAWAAATGTGLIANSVFSGNVLEWSEPAARLIGAIQIRSATDDSGANQPSIMITSGGTDLLGGALTVGETEVNTGVIASGQAVSANEIIDIDCEATGTNADSFGLRARFLIARHV